MSPKLRALLLWTGYAAAASPAAYAMASSLPTVPHAWSLAAPPLLVLRLALAAPKAEPLRHRRAIAAGLVAAGAAAALLGIVAQTLLFSWGGTVLAGIGVALFAGAGSPRLAGHALWLIPIPTAAYLLGSPGVEQALVRLGARVADALSLPLEPHGTSLRGPRGALFVHPHLGGLHTGWMLALVGWYGAARAGRSVARGCLYAAGCAAAAPLAQGAAIGVAAVALAWLGAGAAQAWLEHGVWLTAVATGAVWVERRCGTR